MRSVQAGSRVLFWMGVILCCVFVYWWSRRSASWRVSFYTLIPQHTTTRIWYWCIVCALTSPVFVLPLLLWQVEWTHQTWSERNQEIVVLIDISYSMSADDVWSTRSRLWQEILSWLLEQLIVSESDYVSVGVVYFAGSPLVVHPVSSSLRVAQQYIEWAFPDAIDQSRSVRTWTAMGEALILADAMFTSTAEERSVIVISDWWANTWTDPEQVASTLQSRWVNVYTVWVWTAVWWPVTVPTVLWTVVQEAWWVDRSSLQRIAVNGWWVFFGAWSIQQWWQVESSLAETVVDDTRYLQSYTTLLRLPFAILANSIALLILLVLRRFGIVPLKKLPLVGVALSLMAAVTVLVYLSRMMNSSVVSLAVHWLPESVVPTVEDRQRQNPSREVMVHDILSWRCVGPARFSPVVWWLLRSIRTVWYLCEPSWDELDLYQWYSQRRTLRLLDWYMKRWIYSYGIIWVVWLLCLCRIRYE